MRVAAITLAAAALAASAVGSDRLDRLASDRSGSEELLYLPNGKHLRVLSLGHASLTANAVYLWAIQYYAEYRPAARGDYVEHVFGNVIAELDPRFEDPYWLGSLILIVEQHDLEAGLRLLDKGLAANPSSWHFPYLAAWECRRAGDLQRAIRYFEKASRVPGAPPHVRRMRAGMVARAGDLAEALQAWTEILEDPDGDEASRAIAERQVRLLRVRADLAMLAGAVEAYRTARGRLPRVLGDLVAAGILPAVPTDPDGNPYTYRPATGEVDSTAGRVLTGW
jgi:tetratricopeptide (TPR) repeat protein